jgi:hypothetical protein
MSVYLRSYGAHSRSIDQYSNLNVDSLRQDLNLDSVCRHVDKAGGGHALRGCCMTMRGPRPQDPT